MDNAVITREQARANGLKTYFTGKPCRHGHITVRRSDNGACTECSLSRAAAYKARNRHICNANNQKWRAENKDKANQIRRNWLKRNPRKTIEYNDRYKSNNTEKVAESKKKWRDKNPGFNRIFRYSNRSKLGVEDTERAERALIGVVGKRLTYRA